MLQIFYYNKKMLKKIITTFGNRWQTHRHKQNFYYVMIQEKIQQNFILIKYKKIIFENSGIL